MIPHLISLPFSSPALARFRWPATRHRRRERGAACGSRSTHVKSEVNNRASTILRLAAVAVGKTDSWLGHFYRRIRARRGRPKAVTATARKLACIVYHMIKYGRTLPGQISNNTKPRPKLTDCDGCEKKPNHLGSSSKNSNRRLSCHLKASHARHGWKGGNDWRSCHLKGLTPFQTARL
jgi:hypothetical protein